MPTVHSLVPSVRSNSSPSLTSAPNGKSSFSGMKVEATERRSTADSQPIHAQSQGFKEGGPSGITKIMEADES